MKVAIDVSPLKKGHSVRGIGSYTQNLVDEFKKGEFKQIEFTFFENPTSLPPVDLLHYPYFDLFFRTLPIKKTAGRVVTIHDVIPLVFPEKFPAGLRGNFNLLLQKMALKNVQAIICDSKTSKEDIVSKLSIPKDRIHVVYLAPSNNFHKFNDKEELANVSKKHNLPKKFVLYVGDVNWSKNIPNLLKAIKRSRQNLVMVGKAVTDDNLSETQEINKLIKNLNIEDKIVKTGFIEEGDLAAIYNLASLTILPSYYEGFGLPVLESMACGTPVVCSNVASLSEIGKDVVIFCKPSDPDNISDKINLVLGYNKKEIENLSKKSLEHASKFTWRKVANSTINVYNSLV